MPKFLTFLKGESFRWGVIAFFFLFIFFTVVGSFVYYTVVHPCR